ncbi:GntR family transcriptional regulator [Mycolicibacterium insubricum]|uniref:GntR family transcriptional regulator n=1 Tax=Mycolicibacterium insubricum TaxID=444597 RepID=A0A1X0DK72_9MYCO|nr:FCD domain-containing protein [Mycolicibacterium insubricum]ORA72788.1 GntR family transcriptional regulator [Mycolicibacterium insubricum]BBZ66470.1 GntR family transcriptional regulator [Mycolicibacterium insubricum]
MSLAAEIARGIEAEVIATGWPVGASLGSEAALQQRYGVSRSVLREAVRLVEHHQVARMRRGPGGGLIVTEPDARPATRAVVSYLAYAGTTLDEVLGARRLLEPLASGLAAERIDEAGIRSLRALLASDRSGPVHDDIHVVLAELTGNPVLALFTDVLSRMTVRYAAAAESGAAAGRRALAAMAADHDDIIAAVTAGDRVKATTVTSRHLDTVAGLLAGRSPGAPRRTIAPSGAGDKRAETLAATISEDIVGAGWVPGAVVGAEADLLDRYGVSRSVLREAIRILEFHTVARMRRGPGGGLVVTAPEPQASIDTVALYLEYRRPSREDLQVVRDAIEIDAVATVAAGVAAGDLVLPALGPGTVASAVHTAAHDPQHTDAAEANFHTGMAELAGNSVLTLFLRILVELFRRHWAAQGDQPVPGPEDAAQVDLAHAKILEAVVAGDDGLARHRSRRHLEALSSWWL